MEHRRLGSTGTIVSAQCLGTMTFGHESDDESAYAQLDLFVERGGNFIDTADVYSLGRSEEIIGKWLVARSGRRDRLVIGTQEPQGAAVVDRIRCRVRPAGPERERVQADVAE